MEAVVPRPETVVANVDVIGGAPAAERKLPAFAVALQPRAIAVFNFPPIGIRPSVLRFTARILGAKIAFFYMVEPNNSIGTDPHERGR